MKFLVDAQLPRRVVLWLRAAGFDAVHTLDLPGANCTSDRVLLRVAAAEQRVVITKDADFVDSFLLSGRPENCCSFQPATSQTLNWKHCFFRALTPSSQRSAVMTSRS